MTVADAEEPKKDGEKKAEPASFEGELAASSDRIRETAKWLVATFGAVAGVFIAGLQLSDLGKIEGSDRTIAAIGALVAIAAVVAIIALASAVLGRGRVALSDLTADSRRRRRLVKELERSPGLHAPYPSITGFVEAVNAEWRKQADSWLRKLKTKDPAAAAAAKAEYEETVPVLKELNGLNRRLLAVARAEDVRLTFEKVRLWIVGLAIVAAVGAGTFAYVNVAPDEEEGPTAVAQRPVAAFADLTVDGEDALKGTLGTDCNLNRVPVMALSSSEDGWEVVSLPGKCEQARFTIAADGGELTATETVDLELPKASAGQAGELEPPE